MDCAVEMHNVTKTYPGGVRANDGINLEVESGEIHAVLGENGAGKTTLMNILYGLFPPDCGEIKVHGKPVEFRSPRDAVHVGIGMVHQHFMLVPTLTAAENIVLGSEPVRKGLFNYRGAVGITEEISKQYGLEVDPEALIMNLSVGVQQRIEILKTLYRKANIIVLDEPTAVLTPKEVEGLYEVLRELREEGHTIIFITHKLQEILDIGDRVSVFRKGQNVLTQRIDEVSREDLAYTMVGREVALDKKKEVTEKKGDVLNVEHVSCNDVRGVEVVKDVSLHVEGGEIVGIAGVDGNGQTELVETITGIRDAKEGVITFNGKDVTDCTSKELYSMGMGHVPENRHKHGLIQDFTLVENFLIGNSHIPPYSKGPLINYEYAAQNTKEAVSQFSVQAGSIYTNASTLSGGNQQKFILAREMKRNPLLLVAAQPTRGLDVGAIEFVHGKLLEAASSGRGVLLISMELDEILKLSDRVYVMSKGKITGELAGEEADRSKIGMLMIAD